MLGKLASQDKVKKLQWIFLGIFYAGSCFHKQLDAKEKSKAERQDLLKKLQGTAYAFATEAGNDEGKFNKLAKQVGTATPTAGDKVPEFKRAATAFKAAADKFKEVGELLLELIPHLNRSRLQTKAAKFQTDAEYFRGGANAIDVSSLPGGADPKVQPAIDQFKSAIDIFKGSAKVFETLAHSLDTTGINNNELVSLVNLFKIQSENFAVEAILFDVKAQQVGSSANLTTGNIHTNFKAAADKFGSTAPAGAAEKFYEAIKALVGQQ